MQQPARRHRTGRFWRPLIRRPRQRRTAEHTGRLRGDGDVTRELHDLHDQLTVHGVCNRHDDRVVFHEKSENGGR